MLVSLTPNLRVLRAYLRSLLVVLSVLAAYGMPNFSHQHLECESVDSEHSHLSVQTHLGLGIHGGPAEKLQTLKHKIWVWSSINLVLLQLEFVGWEVTTNLPFEFFRVANRLVARAPPEVGQQDFRGVLTEVGEPRLSA